MRIGLFTDVYPPYVSGVCTSVAMLKEALEKLGNEVYVVTVYPGSFKFEYRNHILKLPGVPVGIYNYRQPSAYSFRAANIIKKWNLDVIHSHTEFSLGSFSRIISKMNNIPLVHTYHTLYEDNVHYIAKNHFNKFIKMIIKDLTLFFCDKTVDSLIVPTKKTYDLFKDKYKVKMNISIIPTGIDIERFYTDSVSNSDKLSVKEKYNLCKDDFIILFLGRVALEKNIDYILNAQEKINTYKKNIKLLVVGDGPELERIKNLNIDNIIYVGKVSWVETPLYYSICDVFVTASTSETQGLTVIEALAASKPVICVNDESFNSLIVNDYNGYLFDTEKEYINAVIKLYEDKNLKNKIGINARKSVFKFSSINYAKSVMNVYEKTIENKKKKV